MSIEVVGRGPAEVSLKENLFWDAKCYTCPTFSKEDGIILNHPQTIVSWLKELTYEQALALAQEHEDHHLELNPDENHFIIMSSWDTSVIKEAHEDKY